MRSTEWPARHTRCRPSRLHRLNSGLRSTAAAATPPPLAVITGANTGIGYETAKALLQRGYRVTMACRDQQRMEAARQRLL